MKDLILSISCNPVKIEPESKEKSVVSQFSEVVKKAFLRANSRCQCERDDHDDESFTCFKQIILEHRGNKTERRRGEAHYFVSSEKGGKLTVENYKVLCWSCYTKTMQRQ